MKKKNAAPKGAGKKNAEHAHPQKKPRRQKADARRKDPRKKGPEKTASLPSADDIALFIAESPHPVTQREIAQAFNIKGDDRTQLRDLLRRLGDGIARTPGRAYKSAGDLPDRALIEITAIDDDGHLRARPLDWSGQGAPPDIHVTATKKEEGTLTIGTRLLARLRKTAARHYEARPIAAAAAAAAGTPADSLRIVGIYKQTPQGGYVYPTNKKIKDDFFIPPGLSLDAKEGDLVVATPLPPGTPYPRHSNPAKIAERLGAKDDPRLISLIAIHSHGIPTDFPSAVMAEAENLKEPTLAHGREDLRDLPFVTIDGADARDFDDAVFAVPDDTPENPGGWHIKVAIADVSFYVTPGSALDKEALKRGNSTYFPDRVVPMLPERLSNDLCSLRPQVPRAALVAHMTIDRNARLVSWRFARGLILSAARLTYEEVEDAHLGHPSTGTAPLMDTVIRPLYKAYSLMKRAREQRGALALDLPERKAIIDAQGQVAAIVPRPRLESHQLIEEFMILANVAAGLALEDKNAPCVYRVHDSPAYDRLDTTRDFLREIGYTLPKGDQVHPRDINSILLAAAKRPDKDLVNTVLLRLQSQAIYSPENIGHFGLALDRYAHFTSPIRRYADLLVHRSLTRACGLGPGGLTAEEAASLGDLAEHISATERRSMLAERDSMDRFTAQYLSHNIGQTFMGRIASVTHFGLFVTLDDSGADGIVPMRHLPRDYYVHDEDRHALVGRDSGRVFRLMDSVIVRLVEADPLRGSTVFDIVTGGDDSSHENRTATRNARRQGQGRRHKDPRGQNARRSKEKKPGKGKGARGKGKSRHRTGRKPLQD